MVTVSVLGLDEYITGRFSREATANLAKIMQVDESEIIFFAPKSFIFHAGVEQTSWQGLIIVSLPETFKDVEKDVAAYLLSATADFLVHLTVEFHYFADEATYSRVNDQYPRFISSDDIAEDDEDYNEDDDESEDLVTDTDESPYMGNIFQDFEKKAQASGHDLDDDGHSHFECCEGDDCDVDDDDGHHHHN